MAIENEIQKIRSLATDFDKLDTQMKIIVSEWQGSYVEGVWTSNLHDNTEKDFSILERLFNLNDSLSRLFKEYSAIIKAYPELDNIINKGMMKLNIATGKIQNGNFTFVDASDLDSFHTSWMELHQNIEAFIKKIT